MSKLVYLQDQWRNFTADRQKDKLEVLRRVDEINDQIAALTAEKSEIQAAHVKKWKHEKDKRKQALDNAAKAELAAGKNGQDILREMGSNNSVWIYKLRQEVIDEYGNVRHTAKGSASEPQPDLSIEGIMWEHHDHQGVHGVLVDTERNYIKRYGAEGTEFEGEFFVADMANNYVMGNKKLFEATPTADLTKRVVMLTQLLDGTYEGPMKISPNRYKQ